MNAVEFVKKFGWDAAKKVLNTIENLSDIDKEDFERLVESWELIQSKGGLENAKEDELWANELGIGYKGLAQAIRDVEKCQ